MRMRRLNDGHLEHGSNDDDESRWGKPREGVAKTPLLMPAALPLGRQRPTLGLWLSLSEIR